jgi:predicted transcriptional regulator
MPYETRRGEKRTTLSVRLDDETLAAIDELARVWAIQDAQRWATHFHREATQWELDSAMRSPLARGEVLRRAVVEAHRAMR